MKMKTPGRKVIFGALVLGLLCGLCGNGLAGEKILEATNLDAIRAAVGTEAVVEGMVTSVGTTRTASITFVNIGLPKRKGFVAVVFWKNYPKFPDGFDQYRNQKVRVRGLIKLYRSEIPEIIMTAADQIEIVKE